MIPQGSCLGPLLFIIYLNDIEHRLENSRANKYADDAEITISSSNKAELIKTAQAELLKGHSAKIKCMQRFISLSRSKSKFFQPSEIVFLSLIALLKGKVWRKTLDRFQF